MATDASPDPDVEKLVETFTQAVRAACTNDAQDRVLFDVMVELERALQKHPMPFHSAHEGRAVIEEEFDELWDEIKAQTIDRAAMRKEAVQLAAMACRFILEVCDGYAQS